MTDDSRPTLEDPELWVDRYGDYLYRFALSRTKDPSVAEDLVQETLLAALQARTTFKGRSTPKSWLAGILKHKIVDYFRKSSREKPTDDAVLQREYIDRLFEENGAWKMAPNQWEINPTKLYEQKEFMDIFYKCLARLPERLSKAFILREIDGLDTNEICKVLNITATNSWVMLYRARMALRGCLEINWIDEAASE